MREGGKGMEKKRIIPVTIAEKEIQHVYEKIQQVKSNVLKILDLKAKLKNLKSNLIFYYLPEEWFNNWEDEEGECEKIRIKVIIEGILEKLISWQEKGTLKIHQKLVSEPFVLISLIREEDLEEFGSVFDGFVFDEAMIKAEVEDVNVETLASDLISPDKLAETLAFKFRIKVDQLVETEVDS